MTVSSLQPLDPKQFDQRCALHLLQRAGFGGTPQQAQALADLGVEEAVDYIVDYKKLPDPDPPKVDERQLMPALPNIPSALASRTF